MNDPSKPPCEFFECNGCGIGKPSAEIEYISGVFICRSCQTDARDYAIHQKYAIAGAEARPQIARQIADSIEAMRKPKSV